LIGTCWNARCVCCKSVADTVAVCCNDAAVLAAVISLFGRCYSAVSSLFFYSDRTQEYARFQLVTGGFGGSARKYKENSVTGKHTVGKPPSAAAEPRLARLGFGLGKVLATATETGDR